MEGNKASTWDEAERWDLEFWQRRTPQERLSAVVAIQRDLEAIQPATAEPLDTDEKR